MESNSGDATVLFCHRTQKNVPVSVFFRGVIVSVVPCLLGLLCPLLQDGYWVTCSDTR